MHASSCLIFFLVESTRAEEKETKFEGKPGSSNTEIDIPPFSDWVVKVFSGSVSSLFCPVEVRKWKSASELFGFSFDLLFGILVFGRKPSEVPAVSIVSINLPVTLMQQTQCVTTWTILTVSTKKKLTLLKATSSKYTYHTNAIGN